MGNSNNNKMSNIILIGFFETSIHITRPETKPC